MHNRVIYTKRADVDGNGEKNFFLVHHHKLDQQKPKYFGSDHDSLFANEKDKYSLLGYINDKFRVNGTFVFLLEYPETPCHYFFSQEVNPIISIPDNEVGMIKFDSNCSSDLDFIGLNRNFDPDRTYLDGIKTDTVRKLYGYFGVGQRKPWHNLHQLGAYHSSHTPYITEENLWMQYDNRYVLSLLGEHFTCNVCPHINLHHFLSLSLYFVMSSSCIKF